MKIHNFSYKIIGRLSIIAEGGIHPKHRLMNYHAFFVNNISSDDAVLDVGCGNGFLTYDIARKARHVTAIDLSPKNIEFAKKFFNRENVNHIIGDATEFEFEKKYDVVVLSNVLEHIDDRKSFLQKIRKLGDKFLVRVPVVNRDWLTYYKRELGCEYFLDSTHKIEYTMDSLREELAEAGMKIHSASMQFGEIWAVVGKSR